MEDILVRGITQNGHFRVAFLSCKSLIRKINGIHKTAPLSALGLTRFTIASLLISTGLKNNEQYAIHLKCPGVLKGFSSDVNSDGVIRVYPHNPNAGLENVNNGLNLPEALGKGSINVIKWLTNLKQPYNSIVQMEYASIAKDFTLYLTKSEQIPSAIVLGEYMDKDTSISHAGGILIQAMPDAEQNEIGFIETTIDMKPTLIEMLMESFTLDMIMDKVVGIMGFNELSRTKPVFQCNCSKGRVESALISTGKAELENIYNKKEEIHVVCEYCKNEFIFNPDEIGSLISELN